MFVTIQVPTCQPSSSGKVCKMWVSVHIFQKAFCPITFERKNVVQPKFYYGLRSSTACLLLNDSSQNPILSAEKCSQCAGVRPSFPYYRVRINGDAHLASRDSAMLRLWDFYQFWHLASSTGNLPILGNRSRGGLPPLSNFWQVAKISWHAAKGTPPDRPWFCSDPYLTSVPKIVPKGQFFVDF